MKCQIERLNTLKSILNNVKRINNLIRLTQRIINLTKRINNLTKFFSTPIELIMYNLGVSILGIRLKEITTKLND